MGAEYLLFSIFISRNGSKISGRILNYFSLYTHNRPKKQELLSKWKQSDSTMMSNLLVWIRHRKSRSSRH